MGAELVYVGGDGTQGPYTVQRRKVAHELAAAEEGACLLDQHNNPGNPGGYRQLAHELLADIFGDVDYLISPIGTGGLLCGTTRELRSLGSGVVTIGVEPAGSTIFGGPGGKYRQTGSGSPKGFPIGNNVDYSMIDEGVQITDVDAFAAARVVSRRTGLLIGGSTGGAVCVALQKLAKLPADSTVVTVVADSGEKYLDTVFNNDWMRQWELLDPLAEEQVEQLLISYGMSAGYEPHAVRQPGGFFDEHRAPASRISATDSHGLTYCWDTASPGGLDDHRSDHDGLVRCHRHCRRGIGDHALQSASHDVCRNGDGGRQFGCRRSGPWGGALRK